MLMLILMLMMKLMMKMMMKKKKKKKNGTKPAKNACLFGGLFWVVRMTTNADVPLMTGERLDLTCLD